jgi:hypothetical protein
LKWKSSEQRASSSPFLKCFFTSGVELELLHEIRVVAAGVFDFPGLHRGVLADLVGGFAGEALLDEREQDVWLFHMPSERPRFFFMFAG